jgi:HPt (histidine-containing phosphotransfer) domain-containing protein
VHVPRPGLPEEAVASLRASFLGEVRSRLPRLQALLDGAGDPEEVRRDAHTLASSAVIVGEPAISRASRAAEDDLTADTVRALVDLLTALLADVPTEGDA